ncbi:MAG TPA: hypothetical protein PJ986_10540 [Gammaproteobacteria bacterium]|nr:hypothetical protein [Gammaproteobacteria bacterium]
MSEITTIQMEPDTIHRACAQLSVTLTEMHALATRIMDTSGCSESYLLVSLIDGIRPIPSLLNEAAEKARKESEQ